jgi:hypothetical protein
MFLFLTSFTTTETSLIPLVILALALDFAIVGVWYMVGYALNNSKVVEGAKSEAYQAVGTAILAAIIIGSLLVFASAFDSALTSSHFLYSSKTASSATAPMSPGTVDTLCNYLNSHSSLSIFSGSYSFLKSSDPQFPGLCSMTSLDSPTRKIDYPLVASGVILANITNQTFHNLNSFFILDSYVGFLSNFKPTVAWCEPGLTYSIEMEVDVISASIGCSAAAFFAGGEGGIGAWVNLPIFYTRITFAPYAGYNIIYSELGTLGSLLTMSANSFIAQFLILIISLYVWPWLIFGGLVLRSTLFTRKIGGLLIAVGLGMILIFPAIFSLEYLGLGNGISGLISSSSGTCSSGSGQGCIGYDYGFNTIASNEITFIPGYPSGTTNVQYSPNNAVQDPYNLNFFVEPEINKIAYYYWCWPTDNNLVLGESLDTIEMLVPGVSLFEAAASNVEGIIGNPPSIAIDPNCKPNDLLRVFNKLMESYGIIGITSFFLPIINIFIVLSSIIGLSGLFGGDTDLAGLSKLI